MATRRQAIIVATLFATVAGFAGAMVYPDRLMVPAFGLFASFVGMLFAPGDC